MMSFQSIQQEVDELFDRADHPNISHKDDGDFQPLLTKIKTLPISSSLSIIIMKDIIEAIMYISTHLLIHKPCQVFKEHVIGKAGKWGLINVICYRDPNQKKSFNPESYYPLDYYEHDDEGSELVWSLGRMWFEMLTDSRLPPIKNLTQKDIDNFVENSGIDNERIIQMLKRMLVVNRKKRKDLTEVIEHGLFQYEERSKIYSKILRNEYQSKIAKKKSNKTDIGNICSNPFEEELFKRDFKQSIVITNFLQKVKQKIYNNFENSEDNSETSFSCFLIDLFSYMRLNNLKRKRQKQNLMLVLLQDKQIYTKFVQKLMEIETRIQKKRKKKEYIKFRNLYPALFEFPEEMDKNDYQEQLYKNFKKYLSHYAKCLKFDKKLNSDSKDHQNYVFLINLLLCRSSNYVFSNCRTFLFQDFLTNQVFNLSNVLDNIQKCTDVPKLALLERKILQTYFSPKQDKND